MIQDKSIEVVEMTPAAAVDFFLQNDLTGSVPGHVRGIKFRARHGKPIEAQATAQHFNNFGSGKFRYEVREAIVAIPISEAG